MSKVKINIVPPLSGEEYTLYIYINKVFFSPYIYARERGGGGGCGFEF